MEPPKLHINSEGFVNAFLIDFWIYLTIKQVKLNLIVIFLYMVHTVVCAHLFQVLTTFTTPLLELLCDIMHIYITLDVGWSAMCIFLFLKC